MTRWALFSPLLAIVALVVAATMAETAPMGWEDLLGRPRPTADAIISYGPDPLQHVDLWLPPGHGPHPTVVMIHGGCWQTRIAGADIMDWAAADLRGRGIAVWNIEYRGVDQPGGGYPGTFLDVANAADALPRHAGQYGLAAGAPVVVGHSAGGHLALWLAARGGVTASSRLHAHAPLAYAAAVSLGGLPDLEVAAVPPGDTCGPDVIGRLVGAPAPGRADVFSDTSPARLPQPSIPITMINGARDPVAPPAVARAYAARVGRKAIETIVVPGEGHVEEIAPGSRSWAAAVAAIELGLRR